MATSQRTSQRRLAVSATLGDPSGHKTKGTRGGSSPRLPGCSPCWLLSDGFRACATIGGAGGLTPVFCSSAIMLIASILPMRLRSRFGLTMRRSMPASTCGS